MPQECGRWRPRELAVPLLAFLILTEVFSLMVFLNLMENAIKYTATGTVTVSLGSTEDTVRFEVQDTGIGMTPAVQQRLFQKFSRGQDAEKLPIHGTGLGLYVAKNVVEAHHGKIGAESEGPGHGSRFLVELPVEEGHALPTQA